MDYPEFERLTEREEEIYAELGQVVATDVAHRDDLNGQLTTVLAAKAIIEAIRNASSGAILDQLAVTEPTSDGAEPVLPQ